MDVVDDTDSRISYQGSWNYLSGVNGANGGTLHTTTDGSATASINFNGVAIEFDAQTSSNGSTFIVSLDGANYGPFSLNTSDSNGSIANVWSISGLDGTKSHSFVLRKADGSSAQLSIDAVRITPTPATTTVPPRSDATTTPSNTAAAPVSTLTINSNGSIVIVLITPGGGQTVTATTTASSSSSGSTSSTTTTSTSTSFTTSSFSLSSSFPTLRNGTETTTNSTSPTDPVSRVLDSPAARAGIILGSVVAGVLLICLVAFGIIYWRRRRAKQQVELRPGTTPQYQTTSMARGLPPSGGGFGGYGGYGGGYGGYGRGPGSPAGSLAPVSLPRHSMQMHRGSPPNFIPASPMQEAVRFADTDPIQSGPGPGQYLLYPAAPPPIDHPYRNTAQSPGGSDYPYPLNFNQRSPTPPGGPSRHTMAYSALAPSATMSRAISPAPMMDRPITPPLRRITPPPQLMHDLPRSPRSLHTPIPHPPLYDERDMLSDQRRSPTPPPPSQAIQDLYY